MKELREVLDFCVSAEMVGHRKPDAEPFVAAAKLAGLSGSDSRWVHVGDDFGTDCVGAKSVGMRTILVHPPSPQEGEGRGRDAAADRRLRNGVHLLDEEEAVGDSGEGEEEGGGYVDDDTIRSNEEAEERRNRDASSGPTSLPPMGGEITLPMGAGHYIADGVMADFVDAECSEFRQILDVVDGWNAAATRVEEDITAVATTAESPPSITTSLARNEEHGLVEARNFKFCLECGSKLPTRAKFCSSCGSSQTNRLQ